MTAQSLQSVQPPVGTRGKPGDVYVSPERQANEALIKRFLASNDINKLSEDMTFDKWFVTKSIRWEDLKPIAQERIAKEIGYLFITHNFLKVSDEKTPVTEIYIKLEDVKYEVFEQCAKEAGYLSVTHSFSHNYYENDIIGDISIQWCTYNVKASNKNETERIGCLRLACTTIDEIIEDDDLFVIYFKDYKVIQGFNKQGYYNTSDTLIRNKLVNNAFPTSTGNTTGTGTGTSTSIASTGGRWVGGKYVYDVPSSGSQQTGWGTYGSTGSYGVSQQSKYNPPEKEICQLGSKYADINDFWTFSARRDKDIELQWDKYSKYDTDERKAIVEITTKYVVKVSTEIASSEDSDDLT